MPKQALEDGGVRCSVAAPALREAAGTLGGKVMPDLASKQVDIGAYDAIIVGGSGAATLMHHPEVPKLLRNAIDAKKVLAAICISPAAVLAPSGVIEKKKATVWKGEFDGKKTSDILEQDGKAIFVDAPVVVDGNLITTDGPSSAQAFGEAIIAKLHG